MLNHDTTAVIGVFDSKPNTVLGVMRQHPIRFVLLVILVLVSICGIAWAAESALSQRPSSKSNAGPTVATSSSHQQKKQTTVGNSAPTSNTNQTPSTVTPQVSSAPAATSSPKAATTQSGGSTSGTTSSGTNTSSGSSGGTSSGSSGASDGCTYNSQPAPCIGGSTTGASGWGTPTFDDEFNGTSLNTTVWNTENGWNKNGVTVSTANENVTNGNLVLTLASSSSGAEISTNSYGLPVGGFTEARVYFPGNGTSIYNWPAWWISGPNWPVDGEADIFEGLGGSATTNYHYYSGGNKQSGPFDIAGTWSNAFHTYGIYRGSGHNDVYWDGTLVKTYTTADSGAAESLILTNGCSSNCTPGAQVKVDYVRTWN